MRHVPIAKRARPPAGTKCVELFYTWYRQPGIEGAAEWARGEQGYQNYMKFSQMRTMLETQWALSREHTAMPVIGRFFGRPGMF